MVDDNTVMWFGKYEGTKLANVPASYLLWLYRGDKAYGDLKAYIEDNLQVLESEVNKDE